MQTHRSSKSPITASSATSSKSCPPSPKPLKRQRAPNRTLTRSLSYTLRNGMKLEDYKTILYRQEDGSWVAEIPAIPGCYALMDTREAALAELTQVFNMIADEYREKGLKLPADTTEIVNA